MKNYKPHRQQGAVLVIALVMLLVLTVLAVSSMRGVTLESRITANRVQSERLQNLADAALREGEFRFYGPAHLRDKLESTNFIANCSLANKLNRYGNNRPCLLPDMDKDKELPKFFGRPINFLSTNSYKNKFTGNALVWMPYRGLDSIEGNYFVPSDGQNAFWNSYRVMSGSVENETVNPEYGAALEGKGTFFFLVTAQANDELAAQSTLAVIYLGLN